MKIRKSTFFQVAFISTIFGILALSLFPTVLYHFLYYTIYPLAAIILLVCSASKIKKSFDICEKVLIIFLCYLFLNICFSHSLTLYIAPVCIIPFLILLSDVHNEVWSHFMRICMLGAVFACFTLIFQFIFPSNWREWIEKIYSPEQVVYIDYRFTVEKYGSGIFYDPSLMGGIIVLGVACYLALHPMKKINNYLSLGIFAVLIFLTGKRAHLLAFVTALLVYALFSIHSTVTKRNLKKILQYVLTFSILILIICIIFGRDMDMSTLRISTTEQQSMGVLSDLNGRSYLWIRAIQCFLNNPIFGIGWSKFQSVAGNGNHAHNIYIQLLAETGCIGLILFILVASLGIWRTSAELKKDHADPDHGMLRASLFYQVFFLIYGITGNPLYDYSFMLPYIIFLSISFRMSRNSQMIYG